jgi:hypothetical protein
MQIGTWQYHRTNGFGINALSIVQSVGILGLYRNDWRKVKS